MDEKQSFLRRYGSFPFVLAALLLLFAGIHITVVLSSAFADGIGASVGAMVRAGLAYLTAWIPFSLFETVILCLPLGLAATTIWAVRYFRADDTRRAVRLLCILLAALLFIYGTFVIAFCPGYYGTTLDEKLALPRQDVTASDLAATARWLAGQVNRLSADVNYGYDHASQMPYDLATMCEKLNAAYEVVRAEHPFLQELNVPVKYVANSEVMSYAHITGIYSFFTGEANLNIAFPDYYLPFTAAHEMAHQRGIAREDEANFVAFLVCNASDDAYIRYSGYYELFVYVANQLFTAKPDEHSAILGSLNNLVRGEMGAYSTFYKKYENSTLGAVSGSVNNSYLQMNGQKEGTQSYGLVADLAVQYYLVNIKGK